MSGLVRSTANGDGQSDGAAIVTAKPSIASPRPPLKQSKALQCYATGYPEDIAFCDIGFSVAKPKVAVGGKRQEKKHHATVMLFVGRIEWTRTTDPHLIRVVL